MPMATDDERREVAQSLERYAHDQLQGGLLNTLKLATGIDGTWRDVLLRLADLIEPDTTTDTTKNAQDTTKCDRDALLALADDLGNMSEELPPAFRDMGTSIAHRIREALGEGA